MYQTTLDARQLFAEGSLVLARMGQVGMRIDRGYLEATIKSADDKVREHEAEVRACPAYKDWQRLYGEKTNIASPTQIARLIFKEYGHKYVPVTFTDSEERESASEKAMEHVDHPLVKAYFRASKFRRLRSTYLGGVQREMVEWGPGIWLIHPSFNLNTVKTFRSSCTRVNVQNQYKRDPEFMELCRRMFIPRPGRQNIEIDYVTNEVDMAARYTLDSTAVRECNDPKADPHRDAACKLFFLKPHEVTKRVRNIAKAPFVFAQFFGDYYVNCAANIWHELQDMKNVMVKDSTETILDRLAKNGITKRGLCSKTSREGPSPGTFEAHVKSVEDWYWNDKYPVHTAWKKSWWEKYQDTGGCITKVGFAINDVRVRNEVINFPIQCDAFQCLLWSLIRKSKLIRKYKMDVLLIDEIHDSDNCEVFPRDREDYIEMAKKVMTEDIVKAWPWLSIVPPKVEVECCPVDGAWADKMELIRSGGKWEPKDSDQWAENFGVWA